MTGTFARQDQQRVNVLYPSDDGVTYMIKMQPKYITGSGLTQAGANANNTPWPYGQKNLRHIYIHTTETAPTAGRNHSRRVPCKQFALNQHPSAFNVDGLTGWSHGKLIGERRPV